MNGNPYRELFKSKKKSKLPAEFKLPGQQSFFADSKTGEINASSYSDLLIQIGNALKSADIINREMRHLNQEDPNVVKERREVLIEAFYDRDGKRMALLGEALASEIKETVNREGFLRRLVAFNEIGQGEVCLVTLKEKNVVGFIATSPSQVTVSEIRQPTFTPPEFHINAFILIDTAEIAKHKGDLLGEKYEEGVEAIMVQEDRLWKRMASQASTVRNIFQTFTTFTPLTLVRVIKQVSQWGIPPTYCLFSSDLWEDVVSQPDFAQVFSPVEKWELLQDGYLGTMYGTTVLTDNFRQPNLKVLEPGEIFVVGSAEYHGTFTVRGTLTATPTDRFSEGEAKKGWFFDQICSLVVGNAKSVGHGRKL